MRRPFDPQQQLFYYPETRSRPLSTNTQEPTLKSASLVWQGNIRWIRAKARKLLGFIFYTFKFELFKLSHHQNTIPNKETAHYAAMH